MSDQPRQTDGFTPFLPLLLMGLALGIFLVWQVVAGASQHVALLRLGDQQASLASQAAQTESRLQNMMLELMVVAKKEPAAQAIIDRYRIKFTPPTSPSGTEAASDDAAPARQPEAKPEAKPEPKK